MTAKRRPLAPLSIVAATGLSIPIAVGFLGRLHPAFDSFAQFRAHLAVLLAVSGLAALVMRERYVGATALVFAAASFLTVTGWLDGNRVAVRPTGGPAAVYSLLQLNLLDVNRHPERVFSLIGRLRPDVITLEEVSDGWPERLALLKAGYPAIQICRGGAVAILSRRPFAAGAAPRCVDGERLAMARVDFAGEAIDIAALHLRWPWPLSQSRQIDRLGPALASLSESAILAGDFNAVTWSTAVGRVAEAGGLKPLAGMRPSWIPIELPDALRRWFGLPIDQVLAKGRVVIRGIATADDAGSDHLPVLVRFSIVPAENGTGSVQARAPHGDAVGG